MSKWLRTAVLALIITAIAIAGIAHATTWIFWVGAPNANSPSSGANATWGNYQNAEVFVFSELGYGIHMEFPNNYFPCPGYTVAYCASIYGIGDFSLDYSQYITGSSNYETWITLSSAYMLNGYVYQGISTYSVQAPLG